MKIKLTLLVVLSLLLGVVGFAQAQTPNVLSVASTAGVTTWNPATSFYTEALYMANICHGMKSGI